jgi:hypothetical protein
MILPRRRFLQVLTGLIAAPAVVKADALMRIVAPRRQLAALEIINEALNRIGALEGLHQTVMQAHYYGDALSRVEWSFAEDRVIYTSLPVPEWRNLLLTRHPADHRPER